MPTAPVERQPMFLDTMMTTIFSIFQCRHMQAAERNSYAEFIYHLYRADAEAFKVYVQGGQATAAEKVVVEKVLKELTARMS